MGGWCQRNNCRRYGKYRGMCLYHARDLQPRKPSSPSSSEASSSPVPSQPMSQTKQTRRLDGRWSAISNIRYHHSGWVKCLVPHCQTEAKRHFPFCGDHEQSTLCVHETSKEFLTTPEAIQGNQVDGLKAEEQKKVDSVRPSLELAPPTEAATA
ncbi:hypothetical protein THRCLA_02936 [Thraustotheca clavata]|uniref:Uncharacterized protein n=1 Tax=Thraustotheca clavata TaxID=74557 RepID=A0A1W0A3K0_9STRA|nr:hypothetical protein THRCLA_02936 [Thraustotheca clavata]